MNKFVSPVSDGNKYTHILFCSQCFLLSQLIIFSWNKTTVTSQGCCTPDFAEKKDRKDKENASFAPFSACNPLGTTPASFVPENACAVPQSLWQRPQFHTLKASLWWASACPLPPQTLRARVGETLTQVQLWEYLTGLKENPGPNRI